MSHADTCEWSKPDIVVASVHVNAKDVWLAGQIRNMIPNISTEVPPKLADYNFIRSHVAASTHHP